MKKRTLFLILIIGFVFGNIAKAEGGMLKTNGPYIFLPELYAGVESDWNELFYALSVEGGYFIKGVGAFGIRAGEYSSQVGTLLSGTSTTRLMGGLRFFGLTTSLQGGVDIDNLGRAGTTPVIEARFIWPLILYEEAQLMLHPTKGETAFRNRLGLGLAVIEIAWEYETIKSDITSYSRHGIFIGLFHCLTVSVGDGYIYGGLRILM